MIHVSPAASRVLPREEAPEWGWRGGRPGHSSQMISIFSSAPPGGGVRRSLDLPETLMTYSGKKKNI